MGTSGPHSLDPAFLDLPSFLRDLASWLGMQIAEMTDADLTDLCVTELKKLQRVLLFVDNLETVRDRRLFAFLDSSLPDNVWLIVTGRVHRVKNYLAMTQLEPLQDRAAAHLLRHELKRHGLQLLANKPIAELEAQARHLYCHPLALRWFAWACKDDAALWNRGAVNANTQELESFCVAHTLEHLPPSSVRVLCALNAIEGALEPVEETIVAVVDRPAIEVADDLYELECAGIVHVGSRSDGTTVFSIAPFAKRPSFGAVSQERVGKVGRTGDTNHSPRGHRWSFSRVFSCSGPGRNINLQG